MSLACDFPLVELVRYVSDGTWFDVGTEAVVLVKLNNPFGGLFRGYRNNDVDEEMCLFDEFIVLGHHSE